MMQDILATTDTERFVVWKDKSLSTSPERDTESNGQQGWHDHWMDSERF